MTAATQSTDPRDTVTRVHPADLAPHPANPRKDLGDLTDLIASITAHGVLEPVVVVPAAAVTQAWPQHTDQPETELLDDEYVTLLGHRRVAAAQAAMLDELVVVVRDDLTSAAAQLSAMTAENVARANLTALEEAAAFHALAAQGWPQRRIAAELGCAQSHVSKRVKLLKLPDQLQSAIAAGDLDIADALTFGTLPDDQALAAWRKWRDQPGEFRDAERAVERQRREVEQQAKRKALLDQAAAEGVEVVDPAKRFGGRYYEHELRGKRAVDRARKDGTLVYAISWQDKLIPYSTTPPKKAENRSEHEEAEATQQRERRRAVKAREQACPRVVADLPDLDQLRDLLAKAVLDRDIPDANGLKLAMRWLAAAGIGPTANDTYKWSAAMTSHQDTKLRAHAAWAALVATYELHARSPHVGWGDREIAYLELLQAHGYDPTPWEQARLETARNRDTSAYRRCPDLTCTLPTWHDGPCDLDPERAADSAESADALPDPIEDEEA